MKRSVLHADATLTDAGETTATQDIDDFIYLMSHDVRASVRALIELPQWIIEDLADAGVEVSGPLGQTIEMMNRHTARLDRMLVDLLAYSRVGRMQDVGTIDINAALDEVLAGLRLPVDMRVVRDIGCDHAVMGAQDMGLLWNALISNAVKHHHSSNGTICISTRCEGAMVRLTVSDDGPGIAEQNYEKAMSAMTTLRPRDDVEGSGMGLASVRKIAAHYGGHLVLSCPSADQAGLRVDILLPQALNAGP
jgi:signal transduction histidine kinase